MRRAAALALLIALLGALPAASAESVLRRSGTEDPATLDPHRFAYPGEVTRIRAQFNTPGQYVWHCHIVEHEDNEMMRPYRIGPKQGGPRNS